MVSIRELRRLLLDDRRFPNTGFIYENTDDSNLHTGIFCGISSLNRSYYRVIPPSTTTPSSPPSTSAHPTSSSPLKPSPLTVRSTRSHPHRNSSSNLHRPTTTTTLPYLRSRPKKHVLDRRRRRRPDLPAQSRWPRHLVRLDHPTQKAPERGSGSGSGPFKPAAAALVVCVVSPLYVGGVIP